ncbi:MAG: hypothetical protein M0R80_02465 [Proteobacteria bacterium]|nr:hypothetical protein [Pseudomonadota bacterium]
MYNQCSLEKKIDETSSRHQIAWIPSKFAIKGMILKIRDGAGDWEDGWLVTGVGTSCEDSDLVEHHRVHRDHRKASDVPKGTFKT